MSIVLKNLSKRFGGIQAVKDLELDIAKGSFLSIVGPSGCGKTTTLRMIAGFTSPDSGDIFIDGKLVNDIPPRKRNIGIVFQNYALFPNLNVYENIAFGLKARRMEPARIKEKVEALLEKIGLADLAGHLPVHISGGQQQRVALARALAIEPSVLLLDEPLSALDAKVRMELRYEVKRIQGELSITTIYVTHDQEEALSISDFVAVINKGEMQQFGAPRDIYNQPANRFVADFIGISNIFACKVISQAEGLLGFGGYRIKTADPAGVLAGKEVMVSIRPENVAIAHYRQGLEPGVNGLKGEINGITFLGPIARIRVGVSGRNFLVDAANSPGMDYRIGNAVLLTFTERVCRILKN